MNTTNTNTEVQERVAVFQTSEDLKSALLIVSVTVNLFIFTAWLVIQTDPTLALFLVNK
ncbi:MAG TPA: hypothetical protein PLN95_02865 [Candidatus Saccharibacteria bacterium]|nr:hypothetical protein [Candidatus Saccharibacteria bacterium]